MLLVTILRNAGLCSAPVSTTKIWKCWLSCSQIQSPATHAEMKINSGHHASRVSSSSAFPLFHHTFSIFASHSSIKLWFRFRERKEEKCNLLFHSPKFSFFCSTNGEFCCFIRNTFVLWLISFFSSITHWFLSFSKRFNVLELSRFKISSFQKLSCESAVSQSCSKNIAHYLLSDGYNKHLIELCGAQLGMKSAVKFLALLCKFSELCRVSNRNWFRSDGLAAWNISRAQHNNNNFVAIGRTRRIFYFWWISWPKTVSQLSEFQECWSHAILRWKTVWRPATWAATSRTFAMTNRIWLLVLRDFRSEYLVQIFCESEIWTVTFPSSIGKYSEKVNIDD